MLSKIHNQDLLGYSLALLFLAASKKMDLNISKISLNGEKNQYYLDLDCEDGFLKNTSGIIIEKIMRSLSSEEIKNSIYDNRFLKLIDAIKDRDIVQNIFELINSRSLAFQIINISGTGINLSRVHFLCHPTQDELEQHINHIEELRKCDHKHIASKMDLFHFQEDSPGIAFWHPQGVKIWRIIEDYMRSSNEKYLCQEIKTPLIASINLWEKSGHTDKYSAGMFSINNVENKSFIVRPMNCPTCIQVFNKNLYSYKALPIRLSEFGIVHRNEPSGALNGLFRSRSFTQDDGHIFCMEEQLITEVIQIIEQCLEVYNDFGFTSQKINIKVSLRPEQRIGSNELWDQAESVLQQALQEKNLAYQLVEGDGAFYGPKIEFHLEDSLSRLWQCGTIQIDFFMPQRLHAFYIDREGLKKHPILIHRAILGSLERFIAILLENYSGRLPIWLAPTQVLLVGVTNAQDEYIKQQCAELQEQGIRAVFDIRNEKLGYKIREGLKKYIPCIAVAGAKEVASGNLSVRFDRESIVCNSKQLVHLLQNKI